MKEYKKEVNNENLIIAEKLEEVKPKDILGTLTKEAINFEFKNVSNAILLLINCIMPSTFVFFFENTNLFMEMEFAKLIMLVVSINLIILYILTDFRYSSQGYIVYKYYMKSNFALLRIKCINIIVDKKLKKIEKEKSNEENCSKDVSKAKNCNEKARCLSNNVHEYIKKINDFKYKKNRNQCFEQVLYINISVGFYMIFLKTINYILNIKVFDKYWIIMLAIIYVIFNLRYIILNVIGMLYNIISYILIFLEKVFDKIFKNS